MDAGSVEILAKRDWLARRAAHEARVRVWVAPRLERKSRGGSHPVEDFLFEYYAFRPGQLLRWHPGVGVVLRDAGGFPFQRGYGRTAEGVTADVASLSDGRRASIRWLRDLLERTAGRPVMVGCFGLHEWAMVYRAESVRHAGWPLRLTADEIAQVVEGLGPRCTHYDALRFFTAAARPLNKFAPTRGDTADWEQPGCLHANMDLYKWAFKLVPFSASELVADCFELARGIRLVDMQASPYDLRALGVEAIRIETAAGRAAYEAAQREFARRAEPLRRRLVAVCDAILS